MKKIILLTLIFIGNFIFSQQNAIVTYKIKKIDDKNFEQQLRRYGNNFYKRFQNYFDLAKDFEFLLEFNPDESLYYWQEEILPDDVNQYYFIQAKLLGGAMGKYYQNKKDSLRLYQIMSPIDNQMKRITSNLYKKYNWQITNERDTILGFPVIKAISGNVEVWFTPQIPVPFGPAGFGGLPGLILKKRFLKQFPATEIVAVKIEFSKEKIKIKKPMKGILKSEEQNRKDNIREMNRNFDR